MVHVLCGYSTHGYLTCTFYTHHSMTISDMSGYYMHLVSSYVRTGWTHTQLESAAIIHYMFA